MKRASVLFALILGIAFLSFLGKEKNGTASVASQPAEPRNSARSEHPPSLAANPIPQDPSAGTAPGATKPPELSPDGTFIRKVLSSDWTDPETKAAGRMRVRVVEADFKYPKLRLEESVAVDPLTGKEIVTLLRASVADHVMVGLAPGTDIAAARRALEKSGYRIRSVEPGSFLLAEIAKPVGADAQPEAIREIGGLEEFISFAEPDYLVFPCLAPNDPAYTSGKLWGLHNPGAEAGSVADADIDAPEAWEIRNSAPGVVVAVTDTGIQYNHEDLSGNMWSHPTSGVHGFDAYDDDSDPMDTGGHGTHCAGTIGASGNNSVGSTGVAWQVRLMAVRFLGPNGGSTSDGIRVINYARENGADIISASWGGGGYSQGLYNAIEACRVADIPFVAAAGNDGTNNDSIPHYPSSYNLPNIVAVASSTKDDKRSSFSCYGKYSVDIAAPGSSIWSSYIGGNNAYKYLNGTSMATPHVSGALALAKAQFPGESSNQLISRLYSSADRPTGLTELTSSGGRLNINNLIRGLLPPKDNDDFADARRFEDGYGFWSGSNAGASREPDEDQFSIPGTGNQSLWFAFNSGAGGLVSLDSFSNISGYEMIAFEGGVKGTLKEVGSADTLVNIRGQIRFNAKPNTEYRVVLDSRNTGGQMFALTYSQTPVNDFFKSATPIPGGRFAVSGTNRGATAETFEQDAPHAGTGRGNSVWWRWTADTDEDFTISTSGSDFDTVLAVYTGTNSGNLLAVASGDDRSPLDYTSQVTFHAVAGTSYHIAVDSYRENSTGKISLNGFRSGTLEIIRQPAGQAVELGKRAVFEVSVLSGGEVSYQWFLNDQAIPGQTSANLVIDPVRATDFGSYKVEVRNTENLVVSEAASLSEKQTPPKLEWSSGNQAVASGTAVALAADFSGSVPMTFTWTKNGDPISAASNTLTFPSAQVPDAGAYRITATNSAGSATADFTFSVIQSPWERWEWRRPGVPNAAITDIKVYGGEAFAVAATTLLRSNDGVNWSKSVFPQGFTGNSIAKAGSKFICLGTDQDGAFRIASSSDNAATWAVNTATGFAITYQPEKSTVIPFGGAFIAYNSISYQYGQDFLRSTDGITWTRLTATNLASQSVNLTGNGNIATDGSTLILASTATSSNYRMRYYRSTDGVNWAEYETQAGGTVGATRSPQTAFFDGTKFHLLGLYSIYTSANGTEWDYHYADNNGFAKNSLFATNGTTLFAFLSGSQTLRYYSNPDVRKFRTFLPANSNAFTAAATFGSKVLYGTDRGFIGLAANELEVRIPKETSSTLASIEFTENLFIARTTNGGSKSVPDQLSGDGVTWKQSTLLDSPITTVTGSAFGKYYGTRSFQTAIHSGNNPFDVRLNPADDIGLAPNIAFIGQLPNGDSLAVSSPASGSTTLNTRASGAASWSTATFPLTLNSASKFASLGNRWFSNFGSSSSALIYTSANGSAWTSIGLTGSNPHFATFGGKSWCVYQSASFPYPTLAAYSTNGTAWTGAAVTGIPTNNTKFARRVIAFGSYLVLLGADDYLYFSDNGTAWVRGFTPGKIVDLATGNGQLVAVMKNGGLIQTGSPHPGINAPRVSIVSPQTASTHLIGSQVTIEGTVSDAEDGGASYECRFDSQVVASGTGNSFRFTVTTSDLNGHTVTVRAVDSQGLRQMDSIRLKVVAPEAPNLLTSQEGVSYVPKNHALSFDGVYYAAGNRAIYRSPDGKNWQQVPIPSFANTIYGMASGNGSLVIQFDNGAIITTRDGINWTHFQPNLTDYWVREPIRFSSGVFIAAYQTQGTVTGSVMTSVDGLAWETGAVSEAGYLAWSASDGKGTVIGAVAYQTGVNRTNDNGFNWIPIPEIQSAGNYNSRGIHADGKFVVASTGSNMIHTSTDAVTWTSQPLPAGVTNMPALTHFGGLFFLGKTPNLSHASTDGVNWQPLSVPVDYLCITHSRGVFVAQASAGGIVTSRNGFDWTPVPVPGMPATLSKILSNDSSFLVIDSLGGVWSSGDGAEWTMLLPGTPPTNFPITGRIGRSIAQLNGTLVVAGTGILVNSSDNGASWTNCTLNGAQPSTSTTYLKVAASASEFLAFEGGPSSGTILNRSTNGTAFLPVPGLPVKAWTDLAWNGAEWMLLATDGTLLRSTDGGLTWSQVPSAGLGRASALAWFNNRWIIIGAETSSSSSPYCNYTLSSGDVFQKHSAIGFYNSIGRIQIVIAHRKMLVYTRGESTFASTDGISWAAANLSAGAGNNSYEIHSTRDGFTAFSPSTVAYYPVRTWKSGPDGLAWLEVPSEFNNILDSDNLGERIFLFASHTISELQDKDLALDLPSLAPITLGVGDQVTASLTISNFGRTTPPAGSWKVTAWLAKNRFYGDRKNIPLGVFEITSAMPAPGASLSYPVSFTLPNTILTGDNFLILSLGGPADFPETNIANNTVISEAAAINIPEWEFSVATNGNGQVNRDFAASRYPHKAQVSLTASAGKGATFTGWAGDAYSPNNQITLLMDGNKSVQANFSNRANLQLLVRGMGEVTGLADLGSYPVGGSAALTAQPAEGWTFSHWSGASTDTSASTSVLMDNPKTVTAHFVQSFSNWRQSVFNAGQLADSTISGGDADPDGDGLKNWQEHLHGSHPMNRASTGVVELTLDGDFLRCVFTRLSSPASGTPIRCQAGRAMNDWDSPELEERVISSVDGIETIESRIPHGANPTGFIRFKYVPEAP